MSHTPGPWTASCAGIENHGFGSDPYTRRVWLSGPEFHNDTIGTAVDDANLVAAAPDLLSALQLAVKYLEHPDVQSIPFALNASAAADRANNAITKAMGAGDK